MITYSFLFARRWQHYTATETCVHKAGVISQYEENNYTISGRSYSCLTAFALQNSLITFSHVHPREIVGLPCVYHADVLRPEKSIDFEAKVDMSRN